MNITKELLFSVIKKSNVMSGIEEVLVASEILKIHNPKHIVELGAGAGGWSAVMWLLGQNLANYTLIESMKWGEQNFSWNGELFPKNLDDLKNQILSKTNDTTNFSFFKEVDAEDLEKYDTFRYDGEISFKKFENYIKHSDEKSIFFVDDFKANVCPLRVMNVTKCVNNKILFPLWLSDKESAWVTNEEYRNYILDKLYTNIHYIEKLNIKYIDHGSSEFRCITTRVTKDVWQDHLKKEKQNEKLD